MVARLAFIAIALLGASLVSAQGGGVIHQSQTIRGSDTQQFTLSHPADNVMIRYYAAHCVHGNGGSQIGVEIHIAKDGGNFSRTLRHTEFSKPKMHEVMQSEGPFTFSPGNYNYTVRGLGSGSDLNATAACIGQGEACGAEPFAGTATSC